MSRSAVSTQSRLAMTAYQKTTVRNNSIDPVSETNVSFGSKADVSRMSGMGGKRTLSAHTKMPPTIVAASRFNVCDTTQRGERSTRSASCDA